MTWSFSVPRAVKKDQFVGEQPASIWSLEELRDVGAFAPAPMNRATPLQSDVVDHDIEDPATAERALEDAFARGFEEGQRVGEIGEAARLRTASEAIQDAMDSVQESADRWVGNAEENICGLAIAIARQVIAREVTTDPTIVIAVVRQALADFPVDQALTIRVNPGDLQTIAASLSAVPEVSASGVRREAQWVGDARIAPGGCLVEGRDRIVDGRIDTALERLYRRLTYTGA